MHEYGGGAWLVADGAIVFSNFADGRLYRQARRRRAAAAHAGAAHARSGLALCRRRDRQGAQALDRRARGSQPAKARRSTRSWRSISTARAGSAGRVLAQGHDFFSSPRLSPDGSKLAVAGLGSPQHAVERHHALSRGARRRRHAGGRAGRRWPAAPPNRSSSPNGRRTERRSCSSRTAPAGGTSTPTIVATRRDARAAAPMEAEFGVAAMGVRHGDLCVRRAGPDRLHLLGGRARPALRSLDLAIRRADADRVCRSPTSRPCAPRATRWRSSAARRACPGSVVALDLRTGQHRVLQAIDRHPRTGRPAHRRLSDHALSRSSFRPQNGKTAFGLFYPPHNPDCAAPAGEKPPLRRQGARRADRRRHRARSSLRNQYWTSRGIAVLDVNYGGSTGFGRAYRERL